MEEKTYFFRLLLSCQPGFCVEGCALMNYCNMPLAQLIEETMHMNSADFKQIVKEHKECLKQVLLELEV